MTAPRPTTKWKRRTRVDRLAQCLVHRPRGLRAHARYPVGVAVEAERLPGAMQSASVSRNPDTTYINLHHLYITQRAMLSNGVQAGEENSA